ncbi:acetylglutamate kinase [Ulvibacterium marinum]|uniref:Acetylglutamate kinase n=1 Tax=Ulvibacterium marinum TaxID=2419782 RepID=A0A3B0CHR8_9FLAO|nr:acetylglutamate kinase [Ulvibacterium marinum]RKN83286.1 acetylglutamate kinase [Ulvibacterium marinum]
MKSKLAVVKIGGNVIEDKAELSRFLSLFAKMEGPKILVHGGGKKATQILKKLGMTPKMAGGRRITDAESLEVVTMVYGGLTNKTIVAQLQALACNAIGLSGADADAIRAHQRPVKEIDYGFAGDVDIVNVNSISNLLNSGFVPVFCALTHNGEGQLLNTNADTIASEIAIGMGHSFETTLYYCFEKKGVLLDMADDNSVIKTIDSKTYMEIREKDIISEGMLPKLENCFHALQKNVHKVCIGDISMIDSESKLFTTLTL